MGSNLGPTMAAFAMNMIEQKLSTFKNQPLFYKRYVDDIFAVFQNRSEAESFLNEINAVHSNLKFTIEHGKNNSLEFLDTTITLNGQTFSSNWYIKSTNTGVYVNKSSYSPKTYKYAAIRSLIYRAKRICSNNCFV